MSTNMKFIGFLSDGGNILFEDANRSKDKWQGFYETLVSKLRAEGKPIPDVQFFHKTFLMACWLTQTVPNYKKQMESVLYGLFGTEYEPNHDKSTKSHSTAIEPREGVVDTLNYFRQAGIPFVVLTDSTRSGEDLTRNFGTTFPVTKFISSMDLKTKKPFPLFFEAGLAEIQKYVPEADFTKVAFIGHDLDEILGAHALGISTILFCEDEEESECLKRIVTIHITKFKELERFVCVKEL